MTFIPQAALQPDPNSPFRQIRINDKTFTVPDGDRFATGRYFRVGTRELTVSTHQQHLLANLANGGADHIADSDLIYFSSWWKIELEQLDDGRYRSVEPIECGPYIRTSR